MAYIPTSVQMAQEAAKKQQKLWEEEQKKTHGGGGASFGGTTHTSSSGKTHGGGGASFGGTPTSTNTPSSSSTPIYEAGYVPTAVQMAQEAAKKQQELMNSSKNYSGQAPSTPQVTSQPAAPSTPQVTSQPPASVGTGEIPDHGENISTNLPREDDTQIVSVVDNRDTGPSEAEIIRQMIEDAKKARIASMLASLDKMYDAQLEAIAEEEAGVRPRYYDERNRIQGQSDVNALNFAQYMAGRGIQGSAGGMNELYRNAALQGELGRLGRQEQATYDSLARDRARLKNAYESDKVLAASDIEAQGLQSLINQMNADRAFGLQEAALTGSYKGQPTFENVKWQADFGLQEAGLTGSYKGQPTFENVKRQADEAYRAKSFDEMVRQFEAKYGLDLRQANLNEAKQAIENAHRQGQISYQQKQEALLDAEIAYKQKQTELLGSESGGESGGEALKPGDYKTNPDFAEDAAKVLADPETTYAILMSEKGAAAFIQKYGWDGYNELLRLARGY